MVPTTFGMTRKLNAWPGFLLFLLSVVSDNVQAETIIDGTATYRERIALTPNAVFEATLEDVSIADAPSKVLGRVTLPSPGNPPIHFRIPYSAGEIQPSHRYSVRATIREADQLLFITDRISPVLTDGHGHDVSLMMRRNPTTPAKQSTHPLHEWSQGTFAGDLPCADCPGIHYQIDLLPNGVFYQRMIYQDRSLQVDSVGRWVMSGEPKKLVLRDGGLQPERFAVINSNRLRMLDGEGNQIHSGLNYDLDRVPHPRPIEPRLELNGLYRYMADAGRFEECVTGLNLPVAQEASNADLESAYGRARKEPGQALAARVEATLIPRPRMEGEGMESALVVHRIIKLGPGDKCPETRTPDYPAHAADSQH